ncbi:Coenzyme F420 hydrogenase/dehydrogenase, beta subunit C-terminal domain [Clostridium tyrobutyricum]|uniref:Coenzyme F420 hydrogenase/dehydrogenase, beta subunit C-terminal domain n=1 Tax=Clostridium tyrobutyricum TaxID=1519 RepID=UPI0030D53F6D
MICENNKCTSCYLCYNICPKQCISMNENEYGFVRPTIDKEKCINCNLCRKSCPSINQVKFRKPKTAYASWALDQSERNSSTSGGVASIFSNYIIKNNGIVFGASVEDRIVKHIRVDKRNDLIKLKGSKYVHSKIGDIYKQVKQELEIDKNVLFIGTPCQVAGIQQYLKKNYENFMTVDIICHGVPSQKILRDYIKENFPNEDYNNICFRDPKGYNLKLLKDNKVLINISMEESLYYLGFMKSLFFNEACYECPYASQERVSDITIGDFWGLGDNVPFEHNKDMGVSVILPNTQKGLMLVNKCKDKMFLEERSVIEAVNGNDQLKRPSSKYKNYDLFRKLYVKKEFNYAARKSLQFDISVDKMKVRLKKNKLVFKIIKALKNRG